MGLFLLQASFVARVPICSQEKERRAAQHQAQAGSRFHADFILEPNTLETAPDWSLY